MSRLMRGCVTGLLGLTMGLLLPVTWAGRLDAQCDQESMPVNKNIHCSDCDDVSVLAEACVYGRESCMADKTLIECDACDEYIGSAGTCDAAPSQGISGAGLSARRGVIYCESASLQRLETWVKSHPIIAWAARRPALQASR